MQYRYSVLKYKAVRDEDKLWFNIYMPRRRLQLHFIKTITPVIIWFVSLPDPKHPDLTICDKYKSHPSFTYLIFTLFVTQHKKHVKSKCVTVPHIHVVLLITQIFPRFVEEFGACILWEVWGSFP